MSLLQQASPVLSSASSSSASEYCDSCPGARGSTSSAATSTKSVSEYGRDSWHLEDSPLAYKQRLEYEHARDKTNAVVEQLLREKEQNAVLLSAWSERCRTLEDEVRRLVLLVDQHEKVNGKTPLAKVHEDIVQTDKITVGTTAQCKWTGSQWRPVQKSTSKASAVPQIDPTKSMSKQNPPPCNSYYLVGKCGVPRCKFSHAYHLTTEQVEEMRRGAKFHICNATRNGLECVDPTCVYGHRCPKGPACPRTSCPFDDKQHLPEPDVKRPTESGTKPARHVRIQR